MRKSGLAPVVDENTEILILGTLPSDTSLAVEQYYASPGNDFWKLIGAVLNQTFVGLSYEDKIELLKENRMGFGTHSKPAFAPAAWTPRHHRT